MLVPLAGFAAGFLHVLSGPDHLAAVAPLAARAHQGAWKTGARWGVGHSAGVALVGLLALGLREALPVEALSAWSERLVGVMLIGIGVWSLRQAARIQIHTHAHTHDGETHEHVHFHPGEKAKAHEATPHSHTHAAVGIGTLHGLAGSSHFLGVLPALALPSTSAAVVYLLAFAAGTVLAMAGFSSALGLFARRLGSGGRGYRGLMQTCAAAAIGIGAWWLVG
ncbi:MAG: sulfite exporter TauE/SafE family protein [Verrucomicrobia bacterium]|nr:sulfite exporter TauE/SafE family protein [Verrucomicrobiota bacterium]